MTPLAGAEDVQTLIGRTLTDTETDRVEMLLGIASARFRREAGGQIISRRTGILRLRSCCGRVDIPQRPVIAVNGVTDAYGNTIDVEWTAQDTFLVAYTSNIAYPGGPAMVNVDVTTGYEPVPDDVVGVVAQMTARALGIAPESSGVQQETLGAYTYQMGSVGAAGASGMLPAEIEVARGYRAPSTPVPML